MLLLSWPVWRFPLDPKERLTMSILNRSLFTKIQFRALRIPDSLVSDAQLNARTSMSFAPGATPLTFRWEKLPCFPATIEATCVPCPTGSRKPLSLHELVLSLKSTREITWPTSPTAVESIPESTTATTDPAPSTPSCCCDETSRSSVSGTATTVSHNKEGCAFGWIFFDFEFETSGNLIFVSRSTRTTPDAESTATSIPVKRPV